MIRPAYSPDAASATRAASPQTVPSPYGDDVVHPDIYDAGNGNTKFGYRYWMAMTPYENHDAAYETPCVLACDDGASWVIPTDGSNPLVPLAGGGKADTDIIVDQAGTMWVVYITGSAVVAISTTDGINWTEPVTLFTYVEDDADEVLSPAIVWDGTQYLMFAMNRRDGYSNVVTYLTRRTASAINGTWSAPVDVTYGIPYMQGKSLWHLDVVRVAADNLLYALLNYEGTYLYFALSEDNGFTWHVGQSPIIARGSAAQWDYAHYRGCLVRTATGFDMWYSGFDTSSPIQSRIGKTEITWSLS